jgi:hypothetical protein
MRVLSKFQSVDERDVDAVEEPQGDSGVQAANPAVNESAVDPVEEPTVTRGHNPKKTSWSMKVLSKFSRRTSVPSSQ